VSARAISSFLSISLLLFSASALAEMTVPVDLQLDLLKRVVRFERGFAARGGARLRFVIVERAGDSGSERVVQGAVLGFELFSSRPRIVLNLGQAGRQGLDFSSDLARLARVVR